MEGTDFKDFKKELLNKPNIRRHYDALKPKYDIVQSIIAQREPSSKCPYLKAKQTGDEVYYYCELSECPCQVEYNNEPCEELEEQKRENEH